MQPFRGHIPNQERFCFQHYPAIGLQNESKMRGRDTKNQVGLVLRRNEDKIDGPPPDDRETVAHDPSGSKRYQAPKTSL